MLFFQTPPIVSIKPEQAQTVTCSTSGATIRYTLNGVEPSATSIPVPLDGRIQIASNVTLKARAFLGGEQSAVATADYRVTGAVDGGAFHGMALTLTGEVFAWGARGNGRLGNGVSTAGTVLTPTPMKKNSTTVMDDAVDISGGSLSSMVVDANGHVWGCGDNSSAQLGTNSVTDSSYLVQVVKSQTAGDYLTGMVGVSMGHNFTVAVERWTDDPTDAYSGRVWAWGERAFGRLGDGHTGTTSISRRYADVVRTDEAGNPELKGVVQARAGQGFTLALANIDSAGRGTLWAWGGNGSGQLAQGNTTHKARAVTVKRDGVNPMTDVVDFAVGFDHAVAIRMDASGNRRVWCWGERLNGRLGNGQSTAANISTPVEVLTAPGIYLSNQVQIVQVAAAGRFTLALDSNKNVWSWGSNVDGQLADGSLAQREYAQKVQIENVGDLTDVVYIAAGGQDFATPHSGFALALTSSGNLFGWGYNDAGQAATGSTATANIKWAMLSPFTTQFTNAAPTVSLAVNPSSTSAPSDFTLTANATDSDGTVASVDFYENGTLIGSDSSGEPWMLTVTNRAAGNYTLTAVAKDSLGATGFATQTVFVVEPAPSPVPPPAIHPSPGNVAVDQVMITSDPEAIIYYTVDGSAPTKNIEPAQVLILQEEIVFGRFSHISVKDNEPFASLFTITPQGDTYFEQLAWLQSHIAEFSPWFTVEDLGADGVRFSCVSDPHHNLEVGYTPGGYQYYARGDDGSSTHTIPANSLIPLYREFPWTQAVTIKFFAAMDGQENSQTQSATYDGTLRIVAGHNHSLLIENGILHAWGLNSNGQLGLGDVTSRQTITRNNLITSVTDVAGGGEHTLAVNRDGQVWAWGRNDQGQLGDGTTLARLTPVIRTFSSAKSVAAGASHSLELSLYGGIVGWGDNSFGQLSSGEQIGNDIHVSLDRVLAIAAGDYHSLAVRKNGTVWAWGRGESGQLGNGGNVNSSAPVQVQELSNVVAIAAGSSFSVALKSDGTVWAWGSNESWQSRGATGLASNVPIEIPDLGPVLAIAASGSHAAAVLLDGTVVCWGSNLQGESGSSAGDRLEPAEVPLQWEGRHIALGNSHSMVLSEPDHLSVWGGDSHGQLGLGSNGDTASPVALSMGDKDIDGLLDEWEYLNFGNLTRDGTGDFEGDGLSDANEYAAGGNPRKHDTNGDGAPDLDQFLAGANLAETLSNAWLQTHGIDPATADPESDADNDGLSLREEWLSGSDPANPHSDTDGVLDGADAVPNDADFKFARVPVANYSIIDLGPSAVEGSVIDFNDAMQVLYYDVLDNTALWENGVSTPVIAGEDGDGWYLSRDGVVSGADNNGPFLWKGGNFDPVLGTPQCAAKGPLGHTYFVQSLTAGGREIVRYSGSTAATGVVVETSNDHIGVWCANSNGAYLKYYYDPFTPNEWVLSMPGVSDQPMPVVGGAVDLYCMNGMTPPMLGGVKWAGMQNLIFVKPVNQWLQKQLLASPASNTPANGYVLGINDKGQVILSTGLLWQNGRITNLADYMPSGWSNVQARAINNHGEIVCNAVKNGASRLIVLLPGPELDVDYNHDGEITADGRDDARVARPFRFWINNDRDQGDDMHANDVEPTSGATDSTNDTIDCRRDLEDFARLNLKVDRIVDLIKSGEVQIGFKFVDITQGKPEIRVFLADDQVNGSDEYLKDELKADAQIGTANGFSRSQTGVGTLPKHFFDGTILPAISAANPYLRLIFEGVSSGTGTLAVVLKMADGSETVIPQIPMTLVPVEKMFEHWTVGDSADVEVAAVAKTASRTSDSGEYTAQSREEQSCIVMVHGWRMTTVERRQFAATAYKRLWHAGFKGRFFFFSWPTEWCARLRGAFWDLIGNPVADDDNYADSEEKAYHSAEGLHKLLLALKTQYGAGNVRVFAHSMGNIVASEALRIHSAISGGGQLLNTYVACQSAMAAHAFDANAPTRDASVLNALTWDTPEAYKNYPVTGEPYYKNITTVAAVANFYNPDPALASWVLGQDLKPNSGPIFEGYFCNTNGLETTVGIDQFFRRDFVNGPATALGFLNATYEIYAHGAEARCHALGAGPVGALPGFDLNTGFSEAKYNFGGDEDDHSAQFLGTSMIRHEFWAELLNAFGIITN